MKLKLAILRLLAVAALGVCGSILTDYLLARPAFCGLAAGCDGVIFSAYGRPLGVPLPAVGVLGFSVVLCLTLSSDTRAAALLGPLCLVSGLAGLALALVQVSLLRQVCPPCLLVDACALGMAAAAVAGSPERAPPAPPWLWRCAWLAAAALSVTAPPMWAWVRPAPPVPEWVQAHWVPGKITAVEIVDFDCKHCRSAEAVLVPFVQEHSDRVRLVRVVVGRDVTAARMEAAGVRGVPMTWVQDQAIPGVPTPEALRAALRRAERSTAAE